MRRLFAAVLVACASAHADYVCKALPQIPNSTYQQIFEINNANQIAASSDADSGAFVYSAGRWAALPVPPGSTAGSLGALGINDIGDVAGTRNADGPSSQLFLYSAGVYSFASMSPYPFSGARAISNTGIMTGSALEADGFTGTGFIYNPQGKPPYAPGFTAVAPPLEDGTMPFNVILGQMNDAGQFVGGGFYAVSHGNRAFFFDPTTGQYTLFQINAWNTRARGLNNKGDILAEALDPATGNWRNFIVNAQGTTEVTCPNLYQGSNGLFMVGINDQGVISVSTGDITGTGGIAFPDVASALSDLIDSSNGPGKSLAAKARAASGAYAAGDLAGACEALAGYAGELSAQTGKHVDALLAPSLSSEISAIEAALHCQ